ncbi:DUF397 domain-containing protein [Kitasatospora sp. NPDC008050]|uniref:DUF397 domain-containing protein n=1 Tax=Kitasatospora sp. NPDC008050 TaxID=3364021 RepID=UPI0036E3161B
MSSAITVEGYDPAGAPGLEWIKSSMCRPTQLDDCIGLAADGDRVRIGITTDPNQIPLTATRDELSAFVRGAQAGDFDHLI